MIQLSTLDFLKDLAQNNNREWFLDNKPRFDNAQADAIDFAAALLKELHIAEPSTGYNSIEPKKCVMRIYRDIRFSKDKTPYKTNFGIGKLLPGTKAEGIGFYVHVQPGASFIGGGYWMPPADHLKAIRQEIDYNAALLKEIIDEPAFKTMFGEFRDQDKLRSMPRNYDATHPDAELIKLKSFVAAHYIADDAWLKPNAAQFTARVISCIRPLTAFLNNAVV